MTLLYIDGFDDGLIATKGWGPTSYSSLPSISAGRFGGGAANRGSNWGFYRPYPTPPTGTTIVGVALCPTSLTQTYTLLTHGVARVKVVSGGAVALFRSDNDTQVAVSSGAIWTSPSTWRYVELKYTPTTGVCEVRVDGNVVTSGTVPTAASISSITFDATPGSVYCAVDDLYILDTTGTTNNTYLGDVRVQTLLPAADGTNLSMTPDSGTTHYNRVNEASPDTTSYVYSSSTGVKDSYKYQQLNANTASVYGVAVTSYTSKDAPGSANISTLVRLGGTDYINGTAHPLSASWGTSTDIYGVRPSDSAPWTPTDVNGAEFGIQTS